MVRPNEMPEVKVVADAPCGNWVDVYAPLWAQGYLRLSRADRPIGTWLLQLPCWWAVALAAAQTGGFTAWDGWLVMSTALGAFLMRGAGCTWNDIIDRDFAAAVARTKSRPIPSSQVTVRQAGVWMFVQVVAAAFILFSYNWLAVGLGISSLALVAIYPFAKRFTWWPQMFLGLAFNWGVLLLWAAHSGHVGWAAVLLYASGIMWTLFYDTIYAHQDKEDDALIGVKSTARLFEDATGKWLAGFMLASVMFMAAAVMVALLPTASPLALLMAMLGVQAFGWHLVWQLRRLDVDDPVECMVIFRSNRDAGLVVALFFAIAALV